MKTVMRLLPIGVVALGLGLTLSATQAPAAAPAAQAPTGAPVFTAAQATAGRTVYTARCAGCHLADLQGRNEAAPLAGRELHERVAREDRSRVLPDHPEHHAARSGGTLGAEDYLNVTAYLLAANGATAGAQPLTATTSATIGSVATGVATASVIARRRPAAAGGQASRAAAGTAPFTRAQRAGRGAELRAGHRRDAAHAAGRRLADGAPQLPGVEPQPAHRDHPRQRQGPAAGVVVVDERGRRQPDRRRSCTTASCTSPTR